MAEAPSGPGWRGKAGGKANAADPNWRKAAPTATAGGSTRTLKLVALGAAAVAAVVGVVAYLSLIAKPQHAGLVAVAGDPDSAAHLDVPYDPAGWLSAARLLQAVGSPDGEKAIRPAPGAGAVLGIDDDDWLDAVARDTKVDPVVIYVGLVGGVDRDGEPILYPGRAGRPPVKLRDVLDRLNARPAAAAKRKVLVLDAGRSDADPGAAPADFARAVRDKLAEAIDRTPTLAVILATGEDSRAWDSPERGMTMLSHALREGLSGGAVRDGFSSFGVLALADYVARRVGDVTAYERPTAQRPLLLPAPERWAADDARAREFADRPFYQPPNPRPLDDAPTPIAPPAKLVACWGEARDLADPAGRPAPWVYTPSAWRRYQELTLRYEQAAVAGDGEGAKKLEEAMKVEKARIERGADVRLTASIRHALPLGAALGQPWAAAASLGGMLKNAATLPGLAATLKADAAARDRPPTEAHLPLMLHHFATEVVPAGAAPKLDAAWKPATLCRLAAEQAALSVPDGSTAFPYSERIWPVVRATVAAADEARRRGEDRMLTDAPAEKPPAAEFAAASEGYRAALRGATVLRSALAGRDAAFADLPFLGRWVNEAGAPAAPGVAPAESAGVVESAWAAAHALASAAEKALTLTDVRLVNLPELADATRKSDGRLQSLRAAAAGEAGLERGETQAQWLALEDLATLPVPLVGPAARGRNYEAARRMASKWSQNPSKAGEGVPGVGPGLKAQRRLRTAAAARAGESSDAESASRLSAAPDAAKSEFEPAAANARRRWATLLAGLARRAALDHWFGSNNAPYLTAFALDYLGDAAPLEDPGALKSVEGAADAAEARRLAAAAALPWKYEFAPGGELTGGWTTEADAPFPCRFELGRYENLLPASAVVWATVSDGKLLKLDDAAARPRPVNWGADPTARAVSLTATCPVPLEDRGGEATVTATAYFRGHAQRAAQVVAFDGRPHVVQTDLRPPPRAAIALRAEVDPGAVAILIDYSGSMNEPWEKGGGKKKDVVVRLLGDLLPKLPPGTRLSVRLMRVDPATNTESRRIFPPAGREGVRGLSPEDLADLFATLNDPGNAPAGVTPLVPTMELALGDFPKDFPGVKTLIVVTDGADTTRIKDATPTRQEYMEVKDMSDEVKRKLTALVKDDVSDKFSSSGAAIQMVVFGASRAELDLAERMFEPITTFSGVNLGRVIVAENEGTLRRELLEALRPRVKVFAGERAVAAGKPPNDVPRIGVPAGTKDDGLAGAESALWRGPLDANAYALKYRSASAEVTLGRGDAMAVRLRKAEGAARYEFRRECYYRDVAGKRPKVAADRAAENDAYFLHAPNYGVGNPGSGLSYLAAVASVDRVVPDAPRGPDDGPLALAPPRGLWWEVRRTPAGAKEPTRYDRPLAVWNAFGLAAPSWRLVTGGVRGSAELTAGAPFQLAVWPLAQPPASLGGESFSLGDLLKGASKRVGGVRVRAKLEEIAFLGSAYPNTPAQRPFPEAAAVKPRCLVLRIDGDPGVGRLLRARVSWEGHVAVAARQHLYYFRDPRRPVERADVKAYTVILGPVGDDFLAARDAADPAGQGAGTLVELLDLGDALRQLPTRRLDLDLGLPGDDTAALHTLPFALDP